MIVRAYIPAWGETSGSICLSFYFSFLGLLFFWGLWRSLHINFLVKVYLNLPLAYTATTSQTQKCSIMGVHSAEKRNAATLTAFTKRGPNLFISGMHWSNFLQRMSRSHRLCHHCADSLIMCILYFYIISILFVVQYFRTKYSGNGSGVEWKVKSSACGVGSIYNDIPLRPHFWCFQFIVYKPDVNEENICTVLCIMIECCVWLFFYLAADVLGDPSVYTVFLTC